MPINKISSSIFQIYFSKFGSTVYLLKINNKNILIDTSSKENREELINNLKKLDIQPESIDIIIITHHHWDHDANINLFPKAEIYDYNNIDNLLIKDMKTFKTPGHTNDSIVLLYKDFLFSGDTLFYNGIGRTDLPESVPEKMDESLKFLRGLSYKTLCPGHI